MRPFLVLLAMSFLVAGCASAPVTQAQLQGGSVDHSGAMQEAMSEHPSPDSPSPKPRGAARSCHGPKSRSK